MPGVSEGASVISLQSQAYLGVPLEIHVKHAKLDKWAYVSLCSDEGTRLQWAWVDCKNDSVKLAALPPTAAGKDRVVVLELFVNGGYVSAGEKVASSTLVFKNPLRSFHVAAAPNRNTLQADVTLEVLLPHSQIRVGAGGVRLAVRGVTSLQQSLYLPLPRVSGMYDVAFLSGSGGDTELGSKQLFLRALCTHDLHLSIPSAQRPGASPTRAMSVPCRTSVEVHCHGPLHPKDCVFVLQNSGSISSAPEVKLLQAPRSRHEIRNRVAVVDLRDEGLYDVVLALYHEAGTFLCGGRALLTVTDLCSAPAVTEELSAAECDPKSAARPQPPPLGDAPTVPPAPIIDDRLLCVICKDQVIRVKLAPCRHVALCEECFADLQRRSGGSRSVTCPLCRSVSSSSEIVYIP